MAVEKTILAKLNTPVDSNTGQRTQILLQTTPENVIDPETGKNLKQMMNDITYPDATTSESGLMSPQQVTNLSTLMSERTIISEENPGQPCMWIEIESIET